MNFLSNIRFFGQARNLVLLFLLVFKIKMKKLAEINDELSAEDREFLIDLADHIDEMRGMVRLLKKMMKK